MTALVVPGVRVEARFDIVPPPPSPTGILGLAGVVDRRPKGLVGLGTGRLRLEDRDGDAVVELRARSAMPWADRAQVRVDRVLGTDGRSVRAVDLTVLVHGVLRLVAKNADERGRPAEFQAVATLRHGGSRRTVAFDECWMEMKQVELDGGGHSEPVYQFSATRVRGEAA